MVSDSVTPISWFVDHAHLILGWPALLTIVWKFKGAFDKYFNSIEEVKTQAVAAAQTAQQIKENLDVVQNNHLAHLASDIQEVSKAYDKSHAAQIELLSSIDRGIAILVDRSSSKRGK